VDNSCSIRFLSYASDIAAALRGTGEGAAALRHSTFLSALTAAGIQFEWGTAVTPAAKAPSFESIAEQCQRLALQVINTLTQKKFFIALGGDHSSAVGTWSGVQQVLHSQGPLGLIWIDAHMDSHTPQTSLTGNIHGMPLAALLGFGDSALTQLINPLPKLRPEHICLIGIRSFEFGEAELLRHLNVRIFYMDEVKKRGMQSVMQEALSIVKKGTIRYGLSIDIDSMDPIDAPGTGVPEPDGIPANELIAALKSVAYDPDLIGAEIVEFDPSRDKEQKTEKIIINMIKAMMVGK